MNIVKSFLLITFLFLLISVSAQNSNLCTGSLGDPIINITFGNGNNPGQSLSAIVPQASTTYDFVSVYGSPASPVPVDGNYTITNNIPDNSAWFGGATDHTGDANGYMAFFNASPTPGEFYKQSVNNLCPGTVYQFSAWIANVLNPNVLIGIKPNITFRIEKPDGSLVASYTTGDIEQSSSMTWQQYGFFFTAPSDGSSLVLKMTNANVGGDAQPGNDFAIDDINFRACGSETSASFNQNVAQTLLNVSSSSPFSLYGSVNPLNNTYDYLWQYSNNGGNSWNDIINSNNISLSQTASATNGSNTLYRMLNAQKGDINAVNCRTTSNIVTLNVLGTTTGGAVQCNNWLQINANGSGVTVGDLDIAGQKMTIEANFNRTQPYSGGRLYSGDIVSKHSGPSTTNYLLRPNSAEITTSNGYFITPEICDADLNKTYHVAMVYDGSSLKFYRDGFLMSQIACNGDLYQNDFLTTIGAKASEVGIFPEEFFNGYINEVRIWNVAKTQDEIRQFMYSPLINPQTQPGLVGYYRFDDLKNKQGNTQWDGTIFNDAHTNQTNPQCLFTADSCNVVKTITNVTAIFISPDTVCVNTPVHVTNTSEGATNYYWNYCDSATQSLLTGNNLGNIGSELSSPVYSDIVHTNNKYYVFTTNNSGGNILLRMDYGNSLLNTPTVTPIENIGGAIQYAEGLQVVSNNNQWYVIIVGGDVNSGAASKIIKITLGSDIESNSASVTDWGNIGNLSYPHKLYMFQDGMTWYGFTFNCYTSSMTRFNFGNDFSQPPTGKNYGDLGCLYYPFGFCPVNKNGKWYLFVAGGLGTNSSVSRIDFDNSLLNDPVGTSLGNVGGQLQDAYDITLLDYCSTTAYVSQGNGSITQLNFDNNGITSTPTATSLGNVGDIHFPHSWSTIFREGTNIYSFVCDASNNTITRFTFPGCSNADIPGSSLQNPPDVVFTSPGEYNITLSADEGLPTQTSYCKRVTVLDKPQQKPTLDTSICAVSSIRIGYSYPNISYLWNTALTDSIITVSQQGKYWVTLNKGFDCSITDSFLITNSSNVKVNLGNDTGLCNNQSLLLNAGAPGNHYTWQDGSTQNTFNVSMAGTYYVVLTDIINCVSSDTIQVVNYTSPVVQPITNQTLCKGDSVQLNVSANGSNTYSWLASPTLSDITIANPFAFPADTTRYYVNVSNANGCITKDSAAVWVIPKPIVTTLQDTSICNRSSLILKSVVTGENNVLWSPSVGLDNNKIKNPVAMPAASTTYIITAYNSICQASDTVNINVIMPDIFAGNDTTVCGQTSVQLSAYGGAQYLWSPSTGLSDPTIANPIATFSNDVRYAVTGKDINGCSNTDSVQIHYLPNPIFAISSAEAELCKGDTLQVNASGGDLYNWSPSNDILQPSQDTVTIIPQSTTAYTVSINNSVCKVSQDETITVTVLPTPDILITKSNEIDCLKDSAVLTASGGISYTWLPVNGLSNSNEAITVANPETNMIYTVQVTGDNGCTASDTIHLSVLKGGDNKFGMPSAFTPNGDGLNDCFGVRTWKYIRLLDFSIYDRWGKLLFHTTKTSDCWDGMYRGNFELTGTYVYQVHAETDCGVIYKKNTFVLIR